ncbi:hypothetical protein DID88_007372 [Monilinia fructigena]|uniref:Antiviral helicase n=1 Tax=Monilinia fructigena TaxID=38457 RepID=A0A395JAI7_9HELO|nr:hypothetical protein DID88_007372 [Monilinia fructigena]
MDSPPTRPLPTETPNPGGNEFDDLDDLFNYDAGDMQMNDPFSENYVVPGTKGKEKVKDSASNAKNGAGLGIDEAIEVTRKPRVPRVKLDEQKLLSSAGIPKLRKKAANYLKFKGKGHEYSDAARLLAFYQLWLDDLFPKSQISRRIGYDWINEGKPKASVHEESLFDEPELPARDDNGREKTASRVAPIFENRASERPKTPVPNRDLDFDDIYDATPKVVRQNPTAESTLVSGGGNNSLFGPPKVATAGDDGPPVDDLDALLAEAEQEGNSDEMLDDDLEALLAAESDMNGRNQPSKQNIENPAQAEADNMDDLEALADMDMDMNMNGGWIKQAREELERELEQKYLAPSTTFSTEWLNKLQQRWDSSPNYTDLFQLAPTQTRTITRFTREGLEGRVTGYKEVTVPANSATAKNSTSFLRKPADRADFVRGAAGFFPFAPGGLDAVEAAAALEEQIGRVDNTVPAKKGLERIINFGGDDGLLSVPPGFTRGLSFEKKGEVDEKEAEDVKNVLDEEPAEEVSANGAGGAVKDQAPAESSDDEEEDDIDSMLPVEFPALEPHGALAASTTRRGGREWAHMVDVQRDIPNFRELVPDMARDWPFELDTFQKEAVYHLESGDSVFVAAHTSAGKTVVAEYAIALAAKHMTKAIYTSPIKALSNQKFRDFREVFDEVGILTGDVQINPEASCLIMTTEILRSMLYRGADLIRDVEFVIFDEVHYVNDLERGVVWEEVIIMLPEHVTLILLSATVPNTYEFASWVGRTKKKDIYVISTPKRPVPLEHYLWADKGVHKIVDSDKKFIEKGWKAANDVLSGRDKAKALPAPEPSNNRRGGNPRGRGQNGRGGAQRGGSQQRGGAQQRGGRGGSGPPRASHNPGHMGRGGRPGGRTTAAQDKTLWVHLVQFLKKETLLPASTEKSAIHMTIEKSIARLKPEDRLLPQIVRLRDLLGRGIAVHHGGLLPIVKEIVEMLFAQTLVKVLFATETFAMGLNLPTRTVVFSGYRKHDGQSFRNLLPGEYTQMAGRAGRRGLDTVGSVIIVAPGGSEAPPVTELRQMILGEPSKLRSQFRLTYNMILNLLRVEALKIEEMIKRSFSEHATQQLLPEHEKAVKVSEADLAKIKREDCNICDKDLDSCHEAIQNYKQLTLELHLGSLATAIGRRMFARGRLVVYHKDGVRTAGILLRDGAVDMSGLSVHVLEIKTRRDQWDTTDLLPFTPKFRGIFTKLPQLKKHIATKACYVLVNDLECVTNTMVKGVVPEIFEGGEMYDKAKQILFNLCLSWESDIWDELDWSKIKELHLRENLVKRAQEVATAEEASCLECPSFLKHFAMCHDQWLIKTNIVQLRQLMSDTNLQLLPDYEQRIQVLKDLDFIDDSSRVQLKGKVACEIHSADELILTELILDNKKTTNVPTLPSSLESGKIKILELSKKITDMQILHQVIQPSSESNDFEANPSRFGLMEVVYEWARGMSFKNITELTDVLEGTIVRVITRLDETCREVRNAARIIGDPELFQKMQTCQEIIKRDITAVASLYM